MHNQTDRPEQGRKIETSVMDSLKNQNVSVPALLIYAVLALAMGGGAGHLFNSASEARISTLEKDHIEMKEDVKKLTTNQHNVELLIAVVR